MLGVTAAVKDIALQKRQATSASQLANLAIWEGAETAKFLRIDSTKTLEVESFNTWLDHLLKVGIIVDTAADLSEDYANNLTQVEPTNTNRLRIQQRGGGSLAALAATTPPRLYRSLASAGLVTVRDTKKDKQPIAP